MSSLSSKVGGAGEFFVRALPGLYAMTLFKDITAIDNGARFHSVDLHIHSYGASHDVKDASMTPEAVVDSAVRQGLSVVAITDHNSDVNTKRAIDHAQRHYPGTLLVLAGVEVTTAHGHLLTYFAPDRVADLKKFLARLDLVGEMGADSTHTKKSMADTIAEAERLGGICIAAHIDRPKTGFELFAPGFQNWKKDIITSSGLYGLECDSTAALAWYSDSDDTGTVGVERKNIFTARSKIAATEARYHLAHLQGSDSHSMASFDNQKPSKAWTRIKLNELSFEALRVALIDPTARVRAMASVPRTIPRIRGIAITGGFLDGERIHFSDNLNCFVGGRGTGKTTAIRAIAYAFGLLKQDNEEFESLFDSVVVYCEDENGVFYRYTRSRGSDIDVKAKENQELANVPVDAFRIEYFGQGELAKIAENPLKNPRLLQEFLDRHTHLRDLLETEASLVTALRENASRLQPLETAFAQLTEKRRTLEEIEKKLKIAEEGNLRDIVSVQSQLASEKAVRESVDAIVATYTNGLSLSVMERSFQQILTTAGTCTNDGESQKAMADIKAVLARNNAAIKQMQAEINAFLKSAAGELRQHVNTLKSSHQRMSADVAQQLAHLKAKGIATDMPGLEALLKQKTTVAKEIAVVEQRFDELRAAREQRVELRKELQAVREGMTARRKAQLKGINANLGATIKDYTIFLKYDEAGITSDFVAFMQKKMQGTYLQENTIETLCARISPSVLADLVLNQDHTTISSSTGISVEWALKIISTLRYWNILFELQALAKHPKPIITVRTKSMPPKEIPVLQLSDGQRHTILLTIAMLAESNVPLVIDQPEDDLDNAFIFSSIVTTLRAIKERRQVIVVTHNANIAVLGDSELILPMHRENDTGTCRDRGAIDTSSTKRAVLSILEGGSVAFLRRKEMYGH